MLWMLLALVAHGSNALVFVVDKSLLGRKGGLIGQPVVYAFYSALLAAVAIILLPLDWAPLSGFVVRWAGLAGVLHIAALWIFFWALKQGETSRVVPIAGSAVPLFTLLLAVTVLGEVLVAQQLLAVALLVLGGALLSVTVAGVRGLPGSVIAGAVVSGAFFAGHFATMKFVYDNAEPFLASFVYSRLIEAGLALVLLGPIVWRISQKSSRSGAGSRSHLRVVRAGKIILAVFVANKVLAAGAFLLQNYAINLGSVTVVNALQGTQYLWLLLLAAAVSVWWPKLFREELKRVALLQKVAGIGLISLALILTYFLVLELLQIIINLQNVIFLIMKILGRHVIIHLGKSKTDLNYAVR